MPQQLSKIPALVFCKYMHIRWWLSPTLPYNTLSFKFPWSSPGCCVVNSLVYSSIPSLVARSLPVALLLSPVLLLAAWSCCLQLSPDPFLSWGSAVYPPLNKQSAGEVLLEAGISQLTELQLLWPGCAGADGWTDGWMDDFSVCPTSLMAVWVADCMRMEQCINAITK